jgi:biotin/methionine sulfoxide reductase
MKRVQQLAHWGAFQAVVDQGRLVDCLPFEADPRPSPMLRAIAQMVYSPTRIGRPAVRRGWLQDRRRSGRGEEPFVEVSWEEALGLVASELLRVRTEHGPEAIFGGSYGWSSAGRVHHARSLVRRFLFAGGGCVDQVGNYSWGCAQFLLPHVIGSHAPVAGKVTDWPSVIEHTKAFVAFGGLALKNAQISSGGLGAHNLEGWLHEAVRAGCRFVVVSPTRADCPALLGAQWMPIRPNTDTALMLGLAHELIRTESLDRAFLGSHCTGFERLEAYITGRSDGQPKSGEWASGITGIPAADIRALAHLLAGRRSMLTATWSLQRAHHGEQPYWMLIALAAMLGQIGLPGGGFGFGHGSMHGVGEPRPEVAAPEMPLGANPAGRAIPVARIADMLLTPGAVFDFNGQRSTYPDIRLVYWAGGNPFHHHQDLNRLRRAWQAPQTIIVHEPWWTATARHADIVLPATTTLERNDIGGSSRDRYVFAMQQAIAPVGQARNDFDIFLDLAGAGGFADRFSASRDERGWITHLYAQMKASAAAAGIPLPEFESFWDKGHLLLPQAHKRFILMEGFRADPLGQPLGTPSGRIELYSERIAGFGYADCPPHPSWLPPAEWLGSPASTRYPLHLVTVQPADRLHGQLDPSTFTRSHKVAGRERVHIHPADAAARGIAAGDVVRLYNARGACLAGAVLDPGLRPHVLVMATGAWYDPVDGAAQALDRHGNANLLAPDEGTSRLAQGPSALSALVEIEPWQGGDLPVRAFEPPEGTTRAETPAAPAAPA